MSKYLSWINVETCLKDGWKSLRKDLWIGVIVVWKTVGVM